MNEYDVKLVVTFSNDQARQLRELADKECLPMTTLVKQVSLKHLANQQSKEIQAMEIPPRNGLLLTSIFDSIDRSKDIVLFTDLLDMPGLHNVGPLEILGAVTTLCQQGRVAMTVTTDKYSQKQFVFALPGRPMPYPGEDWYLRQVGPDDYRHVGDEGVPEE